MTLTALLACGQDAKEPSVVKEEASVVLNSSPKVVAVSPSVNQSTLPAQTTPSVQRYQICVDAPATPLTPEIRAEQRSWVDRTISMSHTSRIAAVVVDKAGYALHVYNNGKRTRSYPIQLGLDPVYDKVMSGDCRTPEGVYRIIGKRQPPRTAYTHSLLLDYPNFHDYAQFMTMRHQTRQLSLDEKIGDSIAIHGGGEEGRGDSSEGWNWTKGCVALSDENIKDLTSRVRVGTPVVIVRTLK